MTTMNKTEFAEILAVAMNRPKSETMQAVGILFDRIQNHLLKGDTVRMEGIGRLQLKPRKAGIGRNPRTGEPVEIPPGVKLHASLAKALKERAAGQPAAKAA